MQSKTPMEVRQAIADIAEVRERLATVQRFGGYSGWAAIASGVSPERIVALGESLGSGVAVALAARHKIGALVLDSPYSSIADVAAATYWFVPVRALLRDPFHNDLLIGSVTAPTLIVHGTKDLVVPIRFGEKLFALANSPKEFWRVEGAPHLAMGERLAETLDWIDRTVP